VTAPLVPDWPAPAPVRALMTTRGTDLAVVALPAEPRWLRQVHGTGVVRLDDTAADAEPEGDASFTTRPGVVCAVKSADCLPVLLCDDAGTVVAAAHAGWRGLAAGVLEATVRALPAPPDRLMAWLGAAIGPDSFEVGPEVRAAFVAADPAAARHFREHVNAGKYLADLYGLARQRLARLGIARVSGGGHDTLAEPQRFFSYRRDDHRGRMAALVWLSP
jgi:polyphenol oxidase